MKRTAIDLEYALICSIWDLQNQIIFLIVPLVWLWSKVVCVDLLFLIVPYSSRCSRSAYSLMLCFIVVLRRPILSHIQIFVLWIELCNPLLTFSQRQAEITISIQQRFHCPSSVTISIFKSTSSIFNHIVSWRRYALLKVQIEVLLISFQILVLLLFYA
jgi:hypothetical protein